MVSGVLLHVGRCVFMYVYTILDIMLSCCEFYVEGFGRGWSAIVEQICDTGKRVVI